MCFWSAIPLQEKDTSVGSTMNSFLWIRWTIYALSNREGIFQFSTRTIPYHPKWSIQYPSYYNRMEVSRHLFYFSQFYLIKYKTNKKNKVITIYSLSVTFTIMHTDVRCAHFCHKESAKGSFDYSFVGILKHCWSYSRVGGDLKRHVLYVTSL